jgi:TonB family protein
MAVALSSRGASGQQPDPDAPPRADAPTPPPPSVTKPKALHVPALRYPAGAEGEGVVVLELTILADGSVGDVKVRSGEEPFVGAALEAVPGWRFEPATRNGRPVAARVLFEVKLIHPIFIDDDPIVTRHPPERSEPEPKAPARVVEVVVRGRPADAPRTSFSRADVRELPGTFGDPFRAVEIVPGVAPVLTGLPFFFVRGAPPGNVGYFVDGIRVPQLYHLVLGPSVLHPGLVDTVEVYAGAPPVRYGRYAGAVVAATTLKPRADWHAEGNVRAVDAGALVEAPFDEGRGGAVFAGRYSYAGPIIRLFSPKLSLAYFDYQHRSHYEVSPGNQVSVFALGAYDRFDSTDGGLYGRLAMQFHRLDLRFDHEPDRATRLRAAVTLGFDRTEGNLFVTAGEATDRTAGARVELEHRVSDRTLFRAGADVSVDRLRSNVGGAPIGGEVDDLDLRLPNRTAVVTGARADVVLTPGARVTVTPGVRFDVFHSLGHTLLAADPRVSARFDVGDQLSLEHSLGIAHQPASFTLPLPAYELSDPGGELQKSVLSSAGVEWRPGDWTAKVALFQNVFFDQTDALTFARYDEDPERNVAYTDRGTGHSYGIELLLRRSLTRRVGGYLAYTLSRSERSIGRVHRAASFDRTHVVHGVIAVSLGGGIRLGSRVTSYSGLPAILRRGRYFAEEAGMAPPGPDPNIDGRLPAERRGRGFFRLDLRFEKRWPIGGAGRWVSAVAEVMNTTLTREVLETTCDMIRCEENIYGPITIPSVGVEFAL